jgi:hypothetical protein
VVSHGCTSNDGDLLPGAPRGESPRAWARRNQRRHGFEFDRSPPRRTELLVWPGDVSAKALDESLRAAKVKFDSFRGSPDRMFNVHG